MGDRTQLTATVAGTADFLNAYTYDGDQRLLQATQEGQTGGNGVAPKGVGYSYNLDSQITQTLDFDPTTASPHPDIAYGTVTCDAGNRLTGIDYQQSTTTLDDLTWAYDAANRVTSFSSSADSSTASYSYDTVNEVTGGTYTGNNQPGTEAYSFDKNGNRTNTGYTTGTNNQLTSDGTFNYTFDYEGNRVTRTRISSGQANDYLTTYTWDYRNRLTDVNYYNNSSVLTKHVHYVYDVCDHLIGKQLDSNGGGSYTSSEWYALDLGANPSAPALPVLEFDKSGNDSYRFLNGPTAGGVDALMAVLGQEAIAVQGTAGTTTYALADNLGSVRIIVGAASVIVDDIVYNSFGNVTYESGTVAHWSGYAGYHFDADTGLANAGERWYDPSVGRWISQDPLGFGGGDTNVSRYVGNGATDATDPTGLAQPYDPFQWIWHHNLAQGVFKPAVMQAATQPNIHAGQYGTLMQAGAHIGKGGIHPSGWNFTQANLLKALQDANKPITQLIINDHIAQMQANPLFAGSFSGSVPAPPGMTYPQWGKLSAGQQTAALMGQIAKAPNVQVAKVMAASPRAGFGTTTLLGWGGKLAPYAGTVLIVGAAGYGAYNTPYTQATTTLIGPSWDAAIEAGVNSLPFTVPLFGEPKPPPPPATVLLDTPPDDAAGDWGTGVITIGQ